MQQTFKGYSARQIIAASTADGDGRRFIDIDGQTFTVETHDRVELASGDWTATVVLESADERHVLRDEPTH